jgi:hypothetical protein
MNQERVLPDREQLSTLTALVLITLSLVRLVSLPEVSLSFTTLGLMVQFRINTRLLFLFLAAALTTSGADWLMKTHPSFSAGRSTIPHWIIPMLTAYAGGALVTSLVSGISMWFGLGIIVILLLSTFISEFIVILPEDERYPAAAAGLLTLSYLLLTVSFFVIRSAGMRMLFSFPVIFIITTAVIWRLLLLKSKSPSIVPYAASIGLILAEVHVGLRYLPVRPLQEALVLFILAYASNSLMNIHLENKVTTQAVLEYGLTALAAILLVLIFLK